jgi:tetratricopeptide (TPR) repeat protein
MEMIIMLRSRRYAKVNVKVLVILILLVSAIIISLFAARQIRRNILSKLSLEAGQKAYENKDWVNAYKNFQEYLGRNPDNIEILKKYAESRLSIRPLEVEAVSGAISAYRRVFQLDSSDETLYDKLAFLYKSVGNYDELAYIARMRLNSQPEDTNAPLWLSTALIRMNKLDEAQETLRAFIKKIQALSGKHAEYVQACLHMSECMMNGGIPDAASKALEWHNKALEYDPDSVEALINRAKFYLDIRTASGIGPADKLAAARKDLELADKLRTENPNLRFIAGTQWLILGEFDKADAEIKVIDNLSQETIDKYFLDPQQLKVLKYLLASEIAARRGDILQAVNLTEESLKNITEERHRIQILPAVIKIYAITGKVSEARKYFDEYLASMRKLNETQSSSNNLAYLQALVARAEGKPYIVIDILRPIAVTNPSSVELWQLLADAYSKTGQPRQASAAALNVINYYPNNPEIILLLAKSYYEMGQWNNAYETAAKVESLRSNDVVAKLLRIESGILKSVGNVSNPDKESLENFLKELTDFRSKYPDIVKIRILQALAQNYLGQSDKVEAELKTAITDCNDNLEAEIQLANFYIKNKRIDDAVKVSETACKNHPESYKSWLNLAEAYSAGENYEQALSSLKKGLDTVTSKDDKYAVSIKLALQEMLRGERKAGIQLLRDAAAQKDHDIESRLLLLETSEVKQNSEESEKLIDEIKQIEGQSGLWWRLYQARFWLLSDQWRSKGQDISDMLQLCISIDPRGTAPVLLLAELYKKQGDQRRLEDVCRQALVRNPQASDVANELLLLLESQGRYSEAEKILQQTGMNQRASSSWQVRMALNTGDISRAIDGLKMQVSNDKTDAASRIQLARLIYQQTKDSVQSFKYLDDANAITPDTIEIAATKAAILKAEGRTDDAVKVIDKYVADHNDFNAYHMRGLYYANEGKYDLAEKDYKKLTTFEKSSAAGYELLSNFYAGIKQTDKAISTVEEGLAKNPDNSFLERTLMKLFVVQGPTRNLEKAGEILKKLEDKFPNDSDLAKFKVAMIMENPAPQSMETARGLLEKVIKQTPSDIDAYLMIISIAVQERNYDAARNYVIQGLGANAGNQALSIARSRIELDAGNFQTAAQQAKDLLLKNPDNIDASIVFVSAAADSGDKTLIKEVGASISNLETYCSTEQGSRNIQILVILSDFYRNAGDYDNADKKISLAASEDTNNLSVIHSRLLLFAAQKKYDELLQISSSYASAKNPNLQVLMDAGSILFSLDSKNLKEEGLKLFEQAAVLSPASPDAGFRLASALYSLGEKDRAEQKYKELLDKFPNDVRIMNDYAWILQESHQDYAKALELADRGVKLAPDDVHILDTRATILSKMPDKLNEARKDFEKLVEILPSDSSQQAKALLSLGRVCIKLNDTAEAKKNFQRAIEIDQKVKIFTPAELSEMREITG